MDKIVQIIIKEALKAKKKGEVPVGCVVLQDEKVLSKAHNTKEKTKCCINHAEINAIAKASRKLRDWRLNNCELYVTLEPCDMCMEVIRQSRIKKIYYLVESNFNNEKNKNIEKIKIDKYEDVKEKYLQTIKSFFEVKR